MSWKPSYEKPPETPAPPYEMTLHEAVAAIKALQAEVKELQKQIDGIHAKLYPKLGSIPGMLNV